MIKILLAVGVVLFCSAGYGSVSYTHLDVYKRQIQRTEDTEIQLVYLETEINK